MSTYALIHGAGSDSRCWHFVAPELEALGHDVVALGRPRDAADAERLGEQLALLIDGAAARTQVLNADAFPTAAAIGTVLVENAITATAGDGRRREEVPS